MNLFVPHITRSAVVISTAIAFLIFSCGTEKDKPRQKKLAIKKIIKTLPPIVKPPFKHINIAFQEWEIDSDSTYQLRPKNNYGTTISIEKGIFIDKKGKLISGKLKVKYREMHTMNDILLSGIPLNFNAAGMLKRFHSAGMFELRVFKDNNEVLLDSGKVIAVQMSSFVNNDNHHAFYLDETNTKNWQYLKDLETNVNPEKKKIIRRAKQKVKEFNLPLEGYFAFNYMALLDVYLNDKSVEIQKKRTDLTLQSKIKEYGVTWSNIYCYQTIEFMGNKYLASLLLWKKLNSEPWPVWANSALCNLVANADGTYKLELTQSKGKGVYKANIKPFLPLKSLLAFSPSYWKNKYNLAIKKAVAEEMRKQKLADVFRTLEVHQFGIYNVDKLQKEEDYVQIKIHPILTDSIDKINDIEIIYISEINRTVIKYPKNEWGNLTLLPDDNAKLIMVLPNNKIAIASTSQLAKLDYNKLRNNPHTIIEINFETVQTPIQNAAQLAAVLGIELDPI